MTAVTKSSHGEWRAEDKEMLTDDLELSIVTMRRSSGRVTTTVTVGKLEDGFISHRMYQDYNVILWAVVYPRVTRKVVEEQHAKLMKDLAVIRQHALAHYQSEKEPTHEIPPVGSQDLDPNRQNAACPSPN